MINLKITDKINNLNELFVLLERLTKAVDIENNNYPAICITFNEYNQKQLLEMIDKIEFIEFCENCFNEMDLEVVLAKINNEYEVRIYRENSVEEIDFECIRFSNLISPININDILKK